MDDPSTEGRSLEAKNGAMKTTLRAAIEKTMAQRQEQIGAQIALFEADDALPDDAREGEAPAIGPDGKRRRGRPPGSSNKLTDAFRKYVRGQYGDPILKLAERAFADPIVLAQALNMPVAAVWAAQNGILERLLPIFHSAMPAELKVTAKGYLAVGIATAPGSLKPGDQVVESDPFGALLKIAGNQGLSIEGQGLSNDDLSNGQPDPVGGSEG